MQELEKISYELFMKYINKEFGYFLIREDEEGIDKLPDLSKFVLKKKKSLVDKMLKPDESLDVVKDYVDSLELEGFDASYSVYFDVWYNSQTCVFDPETDNFTFIHKSRHDVEQEHKFSLPIDYTIELCLSKDSVQVIVPFYVPVFEKKIIVYVSNEPVEHYPTKEGLEAAWEVARLKTKGYTLIVTCGDVDSAKKLSDMIFENKDVLGVVGYEGINDGYTLYTMPVPFNEGIPYREKPEQEKLRELNTILRHGEVPEKISFGEVLSLRAEGQKCK